MSVISKEVKGISTLFIGSFKVVVVSVIRKMAQTITCAKIGIFARCIASKLRCNSYTSG